MKFIFSAYIESPQERSIFQMLVLETGAKTRFVGKEVVTEYDGATRDEVFHKLLSLYELKPNHSLTISTK